LTGRFNDSQKIVKINNTKQQNKQNKLQRNFLKRVYEKSKVKLKR